MRGTLLALAGGVGGAKLALGLCRILPPEELAIVVNTGDDEVFYGLHISPDLDTVMYTLAGLANPETGWGVRSDTFNALEMMGHYEPSPWFKLGDRDLATHIRRTQLLGVGKSLSQVTRMLCASLGIEHQVIPMSDQQVRTVVETDEGDLPFQEYFVHRQCEPRVRGFSFLGLEEACPSPGFAAALDQARAILFCPSNPFLSIAPILAVPGVRERVAAFSGPRVAVSPIVGGQALRGPAAKILTELGYQASALGAARVYRGLCDTWVLDEMDRPLAGEVRALGMWPAVTRTVMATEEDKVALARYICELVEP